MRDMQNIMKLRHLQPLLQAKADATKASFVKSITNELQREYWAAPFSLMEHADSLFKEACEHKLWAYLARYAERVLGIRTELLEGKTFDPEVLKRAKITDPTNEDVTLDDLREWAFEEFRFLSPLPRSTSMAHNHCEAQMLQTVLDFQRDRGLSFWTLQRDAQCADDEYLAWQTEQAKQAQFKRDREHAALILKEEAAKAARRAVKKLVNEVAGPHLKNKDALVGWPTLPDALRIRNDKLRAYVTKVHDAYRLTENGDILAKPPIQL